MVITIYPFSSAKIVFLRHGNELAMCYGNGLGHLGEKIEAKMEPHLGGIRRLPLDAEE